MKKAVLLFLLFFFQEPSPPAPNPAPAPTASVDAVITASKSGGLTILDADKSKGAKGYAWQIVPEKTQGFLVVDGGKRAVFAPGTAGSFVVVLAVSGSDGQLDIATHNVTSGPGPGPGPGPQPADLASLVVEWAAGVTSDSKKADASKIANAFATVASQVAAGAIPREPEAILKATKAGYETALGAAYAAWRPWFDKLGEYMTDHDSGDYVAQWEAISEGLGRVE